MKTILFLFPLGMMILLTGCEDKITEDDLARQEYIVKWYEDKDGREDDRDWFQVVDIHTGRYQPVPAVMEIEGRYYLAIMSRTPSFSNKVVRGEFYMDKVLGTTKPDTVFKVTKHIRDTLYTHSAL